MSFSRTVTGVLYLCAALMVFVFALAQRFHVYKESWLDVALPDAVPVQDRMSNIWCSGQILRMRNKDTSMPEPFRAFVMNPDKTLPEEMFMTQKRQIRLRQSMTLYKASYAYWAIHLLKGSHVDLEICAKLHGSAFSFLRGRRSMKACVTALQIKEERLRRSGQDDDSDSDGDGVSSQESDAQSSTLSSSQGIPSNESLGIHVCNNALFHLPLKWSPKCNSTRVNRLSFEIPRSDHYYLFFASNPTLNITGSNIEAKIIVDQVLYNTSAAVDGCEVLTNDTHDHECFLPLSFTGQEFVVVQRTKNVKNGSSLTPSILESECAPRKAVYFGSYTAVLFLFMMAAFQ